MKATDRKTTITLTILGIVLLVLCLLSLRLGSAKLSWSEFLAAICDTKKETPLGVILYSVRLPRVFSGIVSGVGLSLSGAILQCVTGNKMASPNLIGVSSGAGFGVILSLLVMPKLFALVPLFAFVGAFLSTLFIVTISRKIGMTRGTVVLVGLAFSAILSAGISFISLIDTDVLVSYNAFSIGSLSGVNFDELVLPFVMTVIVFIISMVLSGKMDLLCLGDSVATGLGLNVSRVRMIAILLASASAASAVSFAGLLGFVGLMSPHIARAFIKDNMKYLLPASALIGSVLVVGADLIGRAAFAPGEMPVGIFMALLGAPFFLCLLLFKGGKGNA